MTWLWWTLGIVVVGAVALVALAGALVLAVMIAEAMDQNGNDES